ncbi:TonB-dependent receptor [Xanthocytophaga agilis]|uniref:TonB-dependent receptor n=1 Tax=Xanthocytophaga agilis TaxID=3048010 RepID=A0AAE3UIA4_9BACT|nr:TonB-dependent receptor [Xanthocytophaga agilis]MDJ1506340.1 TonB-dependent receptor [Xanthocytophaga agilis]
MYTRVNMRGARAAAFRNGVNLTSNWGPLNEDMSFVDHIEFVKGPAGFLMSNGDPSGIYNVVTKKPTGRDFNGQVGFTLGSFDLYRGTLDLDGKLDKAGKALFRFNLMGQTKNSFRPYEFNNRLSVAPVLAFKLDDKTTLTLEYTYQRANMSDPGSVYSFAPNGFGTLPRNFTTLLPGMEPTIINDHSAFINLQHRLNANWKLTGQLAYFNYSHTGTSMWPDIVNADGTMIRAVGNWDAESNYKFGQIFLNGDVQTGAVHHRILAGLDLGTKKYIADFYQYHVLDSAGAEFDPHKPDYNTPVNGYPVWDRTTPLKQRAAYVTSQAYTGIYLQDELGFLDNKIRLTLAGRYTYVKQTDYGVDYNGERVTPRLGLSITLDPQTSLYALYDQSFVPQSGVLRSGGKIKPITGNNMEVGLKKEWFDQRWSSTVSLYRILNTNELTDDPDTAGAVPYSVVLGQKVAQGIEVDIKGELLSGLNMVVNYAYTDSKVTKANEAVEAIQVGDRVPGYATHNFNAWLTYTLQKGVLKGLGLSTGATYQVDRDSFSWLNHDGIARLPDYFRLDGGAFWKGERLRITANVYNILNKYLYSGGYEDWTDPNPHYYSWQVEAPTNYRVSVNYTF